MKIIDHLVTHTTIISTIASSLLWITPQAALAQQSGCGKKSLPVAKLRLGKMHGELVGAGEKIFTLAGLFLVDWPTLPSTIRQQLENRRSADIRRFLQSGPLSLVYQSTRADRFGRYRVHVFAGSGAEKRWLQSDLVTGGLALVYPSGASHSRDHCLKALLAAEKTARSENTGIWHKTDQAIMRSNDPNWQTRVDTYRIVEGNVLSVGQTPSRTYLNFSTNWQKDFTVVVAKRNVKRFKSIIEELKAKSGQTIRVRGWMISSRGPLIEVYHPGQIELRQD